MTKQLLLALLTVFLFTLSVTAQNGEEDNTANTTSPVSKELVSRLIFIAVDNDPSGFFMDFLADNKSEPFTTIRKEFGITEEQARHFDELQGIGTETIDFKEMDKILYGVNEKFLNSNYDLTETELTAMDFLINTVGDKVNEAMVEVFSPEQIQKMDAAILALSGGLESPFLNDRHMTALEMTEEQKKKFADINEETKESREKMIASLTEAMFAMAESGEFKFKDLVGALAKSQEYTKDLKKRRSAVLTASQINKMKTLSRLPKALSVANLLPKWMPGADSWKPGDPVPEGLAPENTQTRPFPRAEKE